MSLLQIPELPSRVEDLERRLAELEGRPPIIPDSLAVPNVYYLTSEGAKKEGEASLAWGGDWSTASSYAASTIVKYSGHLYISTVDIAAVTTGLLTLASTTVCKTHGPIASSGFAYPGESLEGVLTSGITATNRQIDNANNSVLNKGGRTQIWQAEVTREKAGEEVLVEATLLTGPNSENALTKSNTAKNFMRWYVNSLAGKGTGELTEAKVNIDVAEYWEGTKERQQFIVGVTGGRYTEPLPPFHEIPTLPQAYSLSLKGARLVGPTGGNPPPSQDPERWEKVI